MYIIYPIRKRHMNRKCAFKQINIRMCTSRKNSMTLLLFKVHTKENQFNLVPASYNIVSLILRHWLIIKSTKLFCWGKFFRSRHSRIPSIFSFQTKYYLQYGSAGIFWRRRMSTHKHHNRWRDWGNALNKHFPHQLSSHTLYASYSLKGKLQ